MGILQQIKPHKNTHHFGGRLVLRWTQPVDIVSPEGEWVPLWLRAARRSQSTPPVRGEQTWDASAESTSDVELSPASTKDEKGPSKDEKEAFDQYLNKFGENRAGENPGYNRQAFPWAGQPNKKTTPKEAIEAVLLGESA